ncbi:MAG: ATP-binding protein [Burkholderiales bacterium]
MVYQQTADFSVTAHAAEVRQASAWLAQMCGGWGMPTESIGRLDLCLNEVLANIIDHGTDAAAGAPIELQLSVRCHGGAGDDRDAGAVTLTVADAGAPFDPLTVKPRPFPVSLDDVEPGGLGLPIVRSNADTLAYRRENGRNYLSVGVMWPRAINPRVQ